MSHAGTIHEPTTIINPDALALAASSRIDSLCLLNATGGAVIGPESVIHAGSHLVGCGGFGIQERSVVTYNCVLLITTANLRYPASSVVLAHERRNRTAPITLGRESFIGSGAVVALGVTVHDCGVVAAGAYVDTDVPPWTIRYSDGSDRPRPRRAENTDEAET
jgi:maltose O-acetyltransferase